MGCGDPKAIEADIRLGNGSGAASVLGVSKFSVCAKRFMEHFTGFSLSARSIGDGLCDADDLIALRAPAEVVTSAIHFVPRSKPSHVRQFWIFHTLILPQRPKFGSKERELSSKLVLVASRKRSFSR